MQRQSVAECQSMAECGRMCKCWLQLSTSVTRGDSYSFRKAKSVGERNDGIIDFGNGDSFLTDIADIMVLSSAVSTSGSFIFLM